MDPDPARRRAGYALVESARATIARHDMLRSGDVVVVAVSGGPDSTCLLDVLGRVPLELTLHVAHVDHGLAPESSATARVVATRAAEAGYDVHVVSAPDLSGPNLQARARDFRYGFLEAIAAQVEARRIATGHTLDDLVETLLARLVHGAGSAGLAAIPPLGGARMRPLIDVRRRETRAYCEDRGLDFVDDEANEDPRFERTLVRRDLVAGIERGWGEGAVRAVATSARRLREDADALASLAARVYGDLAQAGDSSVDLATEALLAMPRALRRRVLERAVGRVRDRSGGIDAALDALDAPVDRSRRFATSSGAEIEVDARVVRVTRPAATDN
jgi:tRNA(Ile)-lysidine synthase